MRKLVAILLGLFISFTLGYAFLNPVLRAIADWLGPLFGPQLLTLLSTLYLLFSDPFVYPLTAIVWFGVALLGGIIIRRRVGAPLAMMTVFSLFLPLMALSALGILQRAEEIGLMGSPENLLATLPPIPQGLSLVDLFNAPVVGRLIQRVLEAAQSGTAPTPEMFISTLLLPILLNAGKNLVIIIVAALLGVELGRRVEGFFAPWSESLRERLGGEVYVSVGAVSACLRKSLPVLLFAALLLSPVLSKISHPPIVETDGGYYSESLVGFVDPNGVAYIGAAFADDQLSVGEVDPGSSGFHDALMVLFISQETRWEALPPLPDLPFEVPGGMMGNLQSYYNLVPRSILLALYIDVDAGVAEQRAEEVAAEFSTTFNAPLTYILTFSPAMMEGGVGETLPVTYTGWEVEGDETLPNATLVAYGSAAPLGDLVDEFMEVLPVEHGGLAALIHDALDSGALIPGAGPASANGTVLFAGFLDTGMLMDMLPQDSEWSDLLPLLIPSTPMKVGFIGLGSYWLNGVHSPPESHLFDLLALLGLTEPIQFSSDSDLSTLLVVTPNTTITGEGVEEGAPILNLVTTVNLSDPEFAPLVEGLENSTSLSISQVEPGAVVESGNYVVTFSALLPLNIQVTKEVSPRGVSPGGEVEVTVSVTNNDEYPIEDVFLNDSASIAYYTSSATVTGGNQTAHWDRIEPGETRNITYTVRLESSGVYTLMPAEVGYSYLNATFSATSSTATAVVRSPSAVGALGQTLAVGWSLASEALGDISSLVLSSAIAAVVLVISFLEYRNFKRWLHPPPPG
ncbi:DUF11 domain-containing protein [Candidatus Bathyarchaeota archaeon]|nr:MAG: DUF11 domain-containing protein [Candidatus Bathyarchaeota archaeon]